ncbi:MAG TPA: glutathione S-transferase family protein [Allosphingosinicella sp.]|uniref:glutathione S-transferase family protein n=1 Tax=Allosphingosinicella sp. TaxID=2823234 RepID=UPI002ED85A27
MYTLITANRNYSSWSLRPWLLMRQLDIPFEDRLVPFSGLENYEAFRSFAPSGTVPCLIDGDRAIWDSLGITLYLADRHQGIWPKDAEAKAWAQCVVAEMHSGFSALRSRCPMNVGIRVRREEDSDALRRDVARMDEILGGGPARFGGPFLAGKDFTAADAFFAPVAFRIRSHGLEVGDGAAAWVAHMLSLPTMREWEEAALAETHREIGHENEVGASGTIIADYRAPAPAAAE